MKQVDREMNRYLALLRNTIQQRGYTQGYIQDVLGWGRSYISQLLTQQKKLRVEQVLLMLNVIGIHPEDFFAELYGLHRPHGPGPRMSQSEQTGEPARQLAPELDKVQSLLKALVRLFLDKRIITSSDLRAAEREAMAE